MPKIILPSLPEFDIAQICECGQLFCYEKCGDGHYIIYETDQKIEVVTTKDQITIYANDAARVKNYFDLQTNYAKIKHALKGKSHFLTKAIESSAGIRILRQDLTETIISFIISANNNIARISKTLFALRKNFGQNCGDYCAFPTLSQLLKIKATDFKKLGAGYRAQYLADTIKILATTNFLDEVKTLSTEAANKKLMTLKGVGPKVADCILLYGMARSDVMPADTWMKKVYKENFGGKETDTKKVSAYFVKEFGNLAGYAQQYLYNYKRNNEKQKGK